MDMIVRLKETYFVALYLHRSWRVTRYLDARFRMAIAAQASGYG